MPRPKKPDTPFRYFSSSPEIIRLVVMMYVRFPSSLRNVEDLLAERGIDICHLWTSGRRYQSGEIDRSGRISGCGDALARTLMYEAAVVILHRVKRSLPLKDWALAIAERPGPGKARIALARKLSVILHSIWRSGEPFRWGPETAAQ